jgi:hypothetical protein
MEILLGITLLVAILGLSAIVYKELILPQKLQSKEILSDAKIKSIGGHPTSPHSSGSIEQEHQETTILPDHPKQPRKNFIKGLITGIALSLVAFSLYTERIKQSLEQIAANLTQKAKAQVNSLQINNEKIVDGKKWLKFIYQDPSGKKYEGWISEESIHKSVPRSENLSTTDKIYEKLGLQTSEERAKNLKSLKKLQSNLKKQMKILRKH